MARAAAAPVRGRERVPHRMRPDPELEDVKVLAVTIEQAGRMLSLSRGIVYQLVQRGELASFSVGRARRVPVSSIEAFMAGRLASAA